MLRSLELVEPGNVLVIAADGVGSATRASGDFGAEVEVGRGESGDTVRVRIRATLPLAGLLGSPRTLEVTGHAPAETLG